MTPIAQTNYYNESFHFEFCSEDLSEDSLAGKEPHKNYVAALLQVAQRILRSQQGQEIYWLHLKIFVSLPLACFLHQAHRLGDAEFRFSTKQRRMTNS